MHGQRDEEADCGRKHVRTQVLSSGQQSAAATSGQESAEGGDHGSTGPADPWPRLAALQYGQLMTKDEDLGLLGRVAAGSTIQLGASRTSGRSALTPHVDHAVAGSATNHQVSAMREISGTHRGSRHSQGQT